MVVIRTQRLTGLCRLQLAEKLPSLEFGGMCIVIANNHYLMENLSPYAEENTDWATKSQRVLI